MSTKEEWVVINQKIYDNFHLYKEKAGIISPEEIWVCFCEGYMYTASTIEEMIEVLNSEWKDDKHLVG